MVQLHSRWHQAQLERQLAEVREDHQEQSEMMQAVPRHSEEAEKVKRIPTLLTERCLKTFGEILLLSGG